MSKENNVVPLHQNRPYERVAYVFQGGGALGAFQVGVAQALLEKNYQPDWLAGISIGAINAAIIAGNLPEKRLERLAEFWHTIATVTPFDEFFRHNKSEWLRNFYNFMGAQSALLFGQKGFFHPRGLPHQLHYPGLHPFQKLSFYDTTPLKRTLEKLIDFDLINSGKITLSLGAVQVRTGQLIFFNNDKHKIGPEHILASAALPPGFPAVEIDGELYWDGGIYSNTPLTVILDALPQKNSLAFVVDCFSPKANQIPNSLDKIQEREKDIRYSSHTARLIKTYALRQNLRAQIAYLGSKIPENLRNDPKVQEVLMQGAPKLTQIVHLVYHSQPYEHLAKDYNFAQVAIEEHIAKGYENTATLLQEAAWEKVCPSRNIGALIHSSVPMENSALYEAPDELMNYLMEQE